jgi:hypothetical protein
VDERNLTSRSHNENRWNSGAKINQRAQAIQNRLAILKSTVAKLEQTIVHTDTKEFLLHGATKSLGDVENFLLPQGLNATPASAAMWFDAAEFQLCSVNETLIHTHDLVSKYGPNLRVVA